MQTQSFLTQTLLFQGFPLPKRKHKEEFWVSSRTEVPEFGGESPSQMLPISFGDGDKGGEGSTKIWEPPTHLGNVSSVITDRKFGVPVSGMDPTIDYYLADIVSATDYDPYGQALPGRVWNRTGYRFGFNGKETDPEWEIQDYGFRLYDPSIGRFLTIDPLAPGFPWWTPYQFAGNTPIAAIDLDGLEAFFVIHFKRVDNGIVNGKDLGTLKDKNFILYEVTLSVKTKTPDGSIIEEKIETSEKMFAFENKYYQSDTELFNDEGESLGTGKWNRIEDGKTYELVWQGFPLYNITNERNTLHIKPSSGLGRQTFIHPSGGSHELKGCKGIAYESDIVLTKDDDGTNIVRTFHYNKKNRDGYPGQSTKNSEIALEEINKRYQETKIKTGAEKVYLKVGSSAQTQTTSPTTKSETENTGIQQQDKQNDSEQKKDSTGRGE